MAEEVPEVRDIIQDQPVEPILPSISTYIQIKGVIFLLKMHHQIKLNKQCQTCQMRLNCSQCMEGMSFSEMKFHLTRLCL